MHVICSCKLLLGVLSIARGADRGLRVRQVPEAHGAVPVLRHAGAGVQPQLPAAGEHPCQHAVPPPQQSHSAHPGPCVCGYCSEHSHVLRWLDVLAVTCMK